MHACTYRVVERTFHIDVRIARISNIERNDNKMTINTRMFRENIRGETSKYFDVDHDHDDIAQFVIAYDNLYASCFNAYDREFRRTHDAHASYDASFHYAFNVANASRDASSIVANRVQHEHTCAHVRVCVSCAHAQFMHDHSTFDTRQRDRMLTRRAIERDATYTTCTHCHAFVIRDARCMNCYELLNVDDNDDA
jgi:hypothetical protein